MARVLPYLVTKYYTYDSLYIYFSLAALLFVIGFPRNPAPAREVIPGLNVALRPRDLFFLLHALI